MATPYLSEIRVVSFNFAPRGWALCNGQTLSIQQNQALFSLLGTFYGGNGTNNFQLPNLMGRSPVHFGGLYALGTPGGSQFVTLQQSEMPAHTHQLYGTADFASASSPSGALPAARPRGGLTHYTAASNANTSMATAALVSSGNSAGHNNQQPFLGVNFIIALAGIFPSRN
jgi:microcystin-dependent protein